MIYKVENNYVISSHGTWLPGSYDSERTARYAFRFSDSDLLRLQKQVNYKGKQITFEDLKAIRIEKSKDTIMKKENKNMTTKCMVCGKEIKFEDKEIQGMCEDCYEHFSS